MIGLSLLPTAHPPSFQPRWVRPSTGSYPRFSLPMDSSPGFASAARDSDALFGLAFATARFAAWPRRAPQLAGSFYKRHAVTRPKAALRLLVGRRFQVLFHSPPGVLFTFPSRYLCAIGHRRVFRVGGWTPQLPTGFHVSGSTRERQRRASCFAYGALTPCGRPSQAVPLARRFVTARFCRPTTPAGLALRPVCPRSPFARHY